MRCFITGTDTDAGKTYVTRLLLEALNAAGHVAVGFKPVCCGSRQDAVELANAGAPGLSIDEVNPVFYKQPLSPLAAGWMENKPFDFAPVMEAWETLGAKFEHILVEGAGGWAVPLTAEKTMADLAAALNLPVLVVVNNRLGAINHTLLTVRAIEASGLKCAGLILNYPHEERDSASISNAAVLRTVLPHVPVLAEVMHGETALDAADFLTGI